MMMILFKEAMMVLLINVEMMVKTIKYDDKIF